MDNMTRAYLTCALWSSTTVEGAPLDDFFDFSDLAPEVVTEAREECEAFCRLIEDLDTSDWTGDQMGHDFWLTRNRHGAGFWDRGLGTPEIREKLTAWAHAFGTKDLYVGDDNLIYSA